MPPAGRSAFAAAHRVVDRVHGDAAVVRPATEPARAPGLAERNVGVVRVRHLTDGRVAVEVDHADLARRQADLRVVAVFRHERRRGARRADELAALPLLQLDVVDHRAEGDVAERHRVAGLDVGVAAGDDLVADLHAVGRQDVALVAVDVVEERDARGAVGIVLDGEDDRGHADLVALPVDDAVALLMAAAPEARGDTAVVIPAAGVRLVLDELAQRLRALRDLHEVRDRVEAPRRRGRLEVLDSHGPVPASCVLFLRLVPAYSLASEKKSIASPSFRVTIAFFQFCILPLPRPMRRSLPRISMVLTPVTFTLKRRCTASRIWILFASRATSKTTWLCFSRSKVAFSVRMIGLRMTCSGVIGRLRLQPGRSARRSASSSAPRASWPRLSTE